MKQCYLLICLIFCGFFGVNAQTISGVVKDKNGQPLPYASITIKNTAQGTTANDKGMYTLVLKNGTYNLQCQHVGHKPIDQTVTIAGKNVEINFIMQEQEYNLTNIVVKANREDPAYAIIRKAIQKRPEYLDELKKFTCEVYIKGQMQLRNYPKRFMGEKVDFEDGDSSKRKMLFLSESIANYAVDLPKNRKIEVVSTRVSGNSDGLGFGNPQIISFYENMISIGRGLNPRGFISPISNNALNYYNYKFMGTYYENGKEINRIQVIPKRTYEPLFAGYISIIENEWRIYSVQLNIVKEQQMQFLDTLHIEQLYVPLKDKWVIKQQVIAPAGKLLGFDFFGSFLQVYNNFNTEPVFAKGFFNNVVLKYDDSSNKKTKAYWDTIRPIPLLDNEAKDYKKKDSLEQVRKDPKYLDSLDKVRNKVQFTGLLLVGKTFSNEKKKESISFDPLIRAINYNTVEGIVLDYSPAYNKSFDKKYVRSYSITPNIRYGFGNTHFNAHINTNINFGKKYLSNIQFSAGKRVFQFNNAQPIAPRDNTLGTLLYTTNYMKIYEAYFGKLRYYKGIGNGFNIYGSFQYQDRLPLENLTDITQWKKRTDRAFTPNYPVEITNANFKSHKASSISVGFNFRPGTKYAELPGRKLSLGSKYPLFNLSYTQGINGLLGSSVDYSKWDFSANDNLNLKLGGHINYRLTAGGFLNNNNVQLMDYQHFAGNQIVFAGNYLNTLQLASYYQLSNKANLYASAHVQYHLDGLISNKIPVIRKWNWFFVLGGNAVYINQQNNYYEAMVSVENIFKVFRIDFIKSWQGNLQNTGIRITLPGFLEGKSDD